MAVGDTLPHCSGTGVENDPYIYSDVVGFLEVIAVDGGYVQASRTGLVFDANDGVILQANFYCAYIDGKGTEIRNLIAVNKQSEVVADNYLITTGSADLQRITNINFYNMCIVCTLGNITPHTGFVKSYVGTEGPAHEYYNCNFTGIYRGNASYGASGEGMFVSQNRGYSNTRRQMNFYNCTFNINCNTGALALGVVVIFQDDSYTKSLMYNCVINISGDFRMRSSSYECHIVRNYICQNCTFQTRGNSSIVSSRISGYRFGMQSGSAYNYIKMAISNVDASAVTLNFSNCDTTLINKSLGNYTLNGTVIAMQDIDPTASDYIYSETNLNNAGFLVGTVIE